jgi:two-component system, OmpR family, phosphate regulon sensor histidine kinase PhoR
MFKGRLFWQIFPAFVVITLMALFAASWYFAHTMKQFHLRQLTVDLIAQARLVEQLVEASFVSGQIDHLDMVAKELGRRAGIRVTLTLPDGTVVADSAADPAQMDSHDQRPEVQTALAGQIGSATRFSDTVQEQMLYVAVPVLVAGEIRGVVRNALPLTEVAATLQTLQARLATVAALIVLLVVALSLFISRRISQPIEQMKLGAQRFAAGDLEQRLEVGGSEELRGLAEAMNEMAGQLDERLRTVLRQRNEQEAVLASMVEGVLAVDGDERILRINRAAAELLGVRPEEVQGRRLQAAVRKADLHRFVDRALAAGAPVEGDIVLRDPGERYLQAHGTVLRDAEGRKIGALFVLNDITRLRRLENVRRDFVANVSHELKTPITAIKGFVETLLDGAAHSAEDSRRFLNIVRTQADRLNAIIDDLLALSRVEQGEEQDGVPLVDAPLRPVLEAAVQACAMMTTEKSVTVNLFCSPALTARINAPLLEQAVINLLSNAVNYSNPQGKVVIDAGQHRERITIKVQDWGCGIAQEHLPRLFERFYRVDKARSRKQGGTGLGLAIVKHIVQAHGGEVIVHSTLGQGSVFSIQLPVA